MSELEKLIQEKKELERRIALLTDGRIIMDSVKLDTIKSPTAQGGKWAVSYKYRHIIQMGSRCIPKDGAKWVPMFTCENREEAVKMIPKAINELTELYERAVKKEEQP